MNQPVTWAPLHWRMRCSGETIFRATYEGEFIGIRPTHRSIELLTCSIFALRADRLLSGESVYFDAATLLRQLGSFQSPQMLNPPERPPAADRPSGGEGLWDAATVCSPEAYICRPNDTRRPLSWACAEPVRLGDDQDVPPRRTAGAARGVQPRDEINPETLPRRVLAFAYVAGRSLGTHR